MIPEPVHEVERKPRNHAAEEEKRRKWNSVPSHYHSYSFSLDQCRCAYSRDDESNRIIADSQLQVVEMLLDINRFLPDFNEFLFVATARSLDWRDKALE